MNNNDILKGSHRLRKGRVSWSGCFYFISSAKARNAPTLDNTACFQVIRSELDRLETEGLWEWMAVVVMPDHLHMVIRLGEGADLSRAMNLFKGRSSSRINQGRYTKGPVWFRGFHDHLIRLDQPIPNFLKYILQNPVDAHLATLPSDWPYLLVIPNAYDML